VAFPERIRSHESIEGIYIILLSKLPSLWTRSFFASTPGAESSANDERTISTLRRESRMAKATTTIKQVVNYQPKHGAWFAANQAFFNRVAAFYFEVIQAHEKVLDLSNKDALTALEKLTYTTQKNPTPVIPLSEIGEDIPAMFRWAAINAALGSARSFYSHREKWHQLRVPAECHVSILRCSHRARKRYVHVRSIVRWDICEMSKRGVNC